MILKILPAKEEPNVSSTRLRFGSLTKCECRELRLVWSGPKWVFAFRCV